MDYMQAIGAPFPIEYSSNSNLKPKKFEWTGEDSQIKVFIDSAISHGINYKKKNGEKKVAWICESRAIFYNWSMPKQALKSMIQTLEESYDAVFFSDREFCANSSKFHFSFAGSNLPWIKNDTIPNKSKIASIIASPKTITTGHKLRHELAENFKQHKNIIDIFGGAAGSNRVGFSSTSPWPDKEPYTKPYMFQFVIENDKYETYFTEKLTDCFISKTIPIYWGSPDIGNYFNTDGMIILDNELELGLLTPEYYYSKMDAINDNFERVKKMQSSDDILYELIQKL